jgi:hypothetical protein
MLLRFHQKKSVEGKRLGKARSRRKEIKETLEGKSLTATANFA